MRPRAFLLFCVGLVSFGAVCAVAGIDLTKPVTPQIAALLSTANTWTATQTISDGNLIISKTSGGGSFEAGPTWIGLYGAGDHSLEFGLDENGSSYAYADFKDAAGYTRHKAHEMVHSGATSYTITTDHETAVRVTGGQLLGPAPIATDMLADGTGILALDFGSGGMLEQTIDEAVTSVTVTGLFVGGRYSVWLKDSGNRNIAGWPADWTWIGDTEPAATANNGKAGLLLLQVYSNGAVVAQYSSATNP